MFEFDRAAWGDTSCNQACAKVFFEQEDLQDIVGALRIDASLTPKQVDRLSACFNTLKGVVMLASLMVIHGIPGGRYEKTGLEMLQDTIRMTLTQAKDPEEGRKLTVEILDRLMFILSHVPGKDRVTQALRVEREQFAQLDTTMRQVMGAIGRPGPQ